MPRERVVVAMSGGVDSSLSAALLKEAGYEVIGVTMRIWPDDAPDRANGCCGSDAVASAQQAAYKLGIGHFVMDFREVFFEKVIDDFCREYQRGRTPNPCIRCNRYVKFEALLKKAQELDARYLATGHYARIEKRSGGFHLLKGADPAKDQSYFLYVLGQPELGGLLMPVGDRYKAEVKRRAAEMGLLAAERPESQDICFITDDDYRSFVERHVPAAPGDIVDTQGRILGRHTGLAQFTVGQRHRLGIASVERRYVVRLDAGNNRVVVGGRDELLADRLTATGLTWISGEAPQELDSVFARIRYRSPEVPVSLSISGDRAEVRFQQPQWAVTPGQSIVFYRGDEVLGGGIIE